MLAILPAAEPACSSKRQTVWRLCIALSCQIGLLKPNQGLPRSNFCVLTHKRGAFSKSRSKLLAMPLPKAPVVGDTPTTDGTIARKLTAAAVMPLRMRCRTRTAASAGPAGHTWQQPSAIGVVGKGFALLVSAYPSATGTGRAFARDTSSSAVLVTLVFSCCSGVKLSKFIAPPLLGWADPPPAWIRRNRGRLSRSAARRPLGVSRFYGQGSRNRTTPSLANAFRFLYKTVVNITTYTARQHPRTNG